MKALLFRDGRPVVVERPVPPRHAGEARIRVRLAGICGTDLELARGYMGFDGVPGHEFVGVVEEADDPGWIGRRVVGEINAGCGRCAVCGEGDGRHCPDRTVLGIQGRDGAFAEWLSLPVANLHPLPPSIQDSAAVFVEPLAAAHRILEQVEIRRDTRSLVLGDGRLGQLIAPVLARAGSSPVIGGRHPEKLRRLKQKGFRTLPVGRAAEREFDLVVDATGSPSGLRAALAAVVPRGTVVLKSTFHGATSLDPLAVVVDEVSVIGSRCGPFRPAIDQLADDATIVSDMVSGVYRLEDAPTAFDHAARDDALKVLFSLFGS